MARHNHRVLNLTRRCHIKLSQAVARIEAHTCEWVERGVSFRELTLSEVLAIRASQQEAARALPYRNLSNELPGLIFVPPEADRYKFRTRYPLLRQAAEMLQQGA